MLFKKVNFLDHHDMSFRRGDIRVMGNMIVQIDDDLQPIGDEEFVTLDHMIVLPGIVNAHLHPSKEIYGCLYESMNINDVLNSVHKNNKMETSDVQFLSSTKALVNALKKGVTTLGLFTSRVDSDYVAAKCVGGRYVINFCQSNYWCADGVPPERIEIRDIIKNYDLYSKQKNDSKIIFSAATASKLSADDQLIKKCHDYAASNNSRFFIHIHEGAEQVAKHKLHFNESGISRLFRLGVLDEYTTQIHATHLLDSDLDIITRSHCNIIHCPVSNSFVTAGTMPLRKMISVNRFVGLGTDAAMVNPVNDITFDALFALYHHGDRNSNLKVSASEIINMITFKGAGALGLDNIGLIKAGYKADLIFFDLENIDGDYINTPVSILKMLHKETPIHVMVDGKFIIYEHMFVNCNFNDELEKYASLKKEIVK
ncbi:TPA: amidohydrolase family protein [Escherichia coli]